MKTKIKGQPEILSIISDYLNVSIEDIKGKSRNKYIVKARHLYWYFLSEIEYGCLKQSEMFDVNHASIIHGINSVKDQAGLLSNKKPANRIYFEQFNELNQMILGEGMEERLNRETRELLSHVWEKRA